MKWDFRKRFKYLEKARNIEEEKKMGQKWVKKEYEAYETHINTGFPADTSTLSPKMWRWNFGISGKPHKYRKYAA